MLALRQPDHIDHPACLQLVSAEHRRGQVGGGVEVAAVGLLHDHRQRVTVAVGEALGENHLGALAFFQVATFVQPPHHRRQLVVVKTFAPHIVTGQLHTHAAVDGFEVVVGLGHQRAPHRQRGFITGLQLHHTLTSAGIELRVFVETLLRGLVDRGQLAGRRARIGVKTRVQQVFDQHAELRAPVAQVVLPNHGMPHRFERAHQRVADDRRAQMAHVHLFRDVG